jgi:ribonuclease BN (tRNA processing enzyme)
MDVTILGSNGWMPGNGKQTTSLMIVHKGKLILIDAGTGFSNLSAFMDRMRDFDDIHIVLTHYHLDHVVGLMYLEGLLGNKSVTIHGPGKPFYQGVRETLSLILSPPYTPSTIVETLNKATYVDYDENPFHIGNILFEAFVQEHSDYSFGLRIDSVLFVATDTRVTEATFKRAEHCKVLIHECWDPDHVEGSMHSSLEMIHRMLERNSGKRPDVYLIHQNPLWSHDEIRTMRNRVLSMRGVRLADDFDVIEIPTD